MADTDYSADAGHKSAKKALEEHNKSQAEQIGEAFDEPSAPKKVAPKTSPQEEQPKEIPPGPQVGDTTPKGAPKHDFKGTLKTMWDTLTGKTF